MTAAAFGRVSAQGRLSNSSGITGVVRRSRGTYRVSLSAPFSSPDYQVVPLVEDTGRNIPPYAEIDQRTLSTFDIQWRNSSNVLNDYDFTLTVYSSDIVKGDPGRDGRDGRDGSDSTVPGPPGRDGSDASVTSANIVRAVSGTPTNNQIIEYDSSSSQLQFVDPPSGGGGEAPTISNIISAIGGSPSDEQVLTYESTGPTLQWQDIPTPPPSITPVPYITGDPHYWVRSGDGRVVTLILHDVDITPTNQNTDQLLVSIGGNPFRVNPWAIATAPRRINIELSDTQADNITSNFSPGNDDVVVNVELRQGASTTLQTISASLPVITAGKAIALKEDISSSGGGTTVVANPTTDSSDPSISSITIGTTDYRISGRRGARGPAGDDAEVTVANILSAIGGSPSDEQVLTYEATGPTLEWQNAPSGGGGTTVVANPSVDNSDPQLNSITIGSSDYRIVGQKGDRGERGLQGVPGRDSTVPGPAGMDGRDSTVPGPAGPAGRDGSDASVTAANMIRAVGGSPTDDQILAYEATGPALKWVDAPSGGGGSAAPSTPRGTELTDEKITLGSGRWNGLASTDTRIIAMDDAANRLHFFNFEGAEQTSERLSLPSAGFWNGLAVTSTRYYAIDNTFGTERLRVFNLSGAEQLGERRTLGDFDTLGIAVTDTRYIIVNDTANQLRSFTFNGTEQTSERVSLGSGDWEGLTLTDDRYVVVDNATGSKAIRFFNRTSKAEVAAEKIDLPDGSWQAITATDERYVVSNSASNELRFFAREDISGGGVPLTIPNLIAAIGGSPTDEQVLSYESTGNTLEWQDLPTPVVPVPYITGDPHYWVRSGDGRVVTLILHDVDITPANRNTDQLLVNIGGNPFRVNPWAIATAPRRINIELSDTQANNITSNFSQGNDNVVINVQLRQGASTTLQSITANFPIITPSKAIALIEDIPTSGGSSQPAPVGVNQVIVPGTISSEQSVVADGTLTINASTVNAGPYCSMGTGGNAGKLVFSRNGILRIGIGITCRIGSANGRCNPGINITGTGIQVLGRSNGYYRATNVNKQLFRSIDLLVTQNAVGTIQIINPNEAFSNATLLVSALSHIVMFAFGGTAGRDGAAGAAGAAGVAGRDGRDGSDASVTSANMIRAVGGSPSDDQILAYEATGPTLKWVNAPSGGGGSVTSNSIVSAVHGTPSDNQIIQYDTSNTRLEFADLPDTTFQVVATDTSVNPPRISQFSINGVTYQV